MAKFKIESSHIISVDHYEEGELEHVTSYDMSQEIEADSAEEALQKYIENLGFQYNKEHVSKDAYDEDLGYSVLVDSQDDEVLKGSEKYNDWAQNLIKLFSNVMLISIYELKKISINL